MAQQSRERNVLAKETAGVPERISGQHKKRFIDQQYERIVSERVLVRDDKDMESVADEGDEYVFVWLREMSWA